MIRIDVFVYTSLQTATIVEINNVKNNTKPHYTASPVQRHWPHAEKDFIKHHIDNGSTLSNGKSEPMLCFVACEWACRFPECY